QGGAANLGCGPFTISNQVQINSRIRTFLDRKEAVGLIKTSRPFQLRAIAAMTGKAVTLTGIVTSSRDRNEIVDRPDERSPSRERAKKAWQIQPLSYPM